MRSRFVFALLALVLAAVVHLVTLPARACAPEPGPIHYPPPVLAADHLPGFWIAYTRFDGLPTNDVTAITGVVSGEKDWIFAGTMGHGLLVWDGKAWTVHRTADAPPSGGADARESNLLPGLASDTVLCMASDGKELVWVGTNAGLSRVTVGPEGDLEITTLLLQDLPSCPQIKALHVDRDGAVLFAVGSRIYQFKEELLTELTRPSFDPLPPVLSLFRFPAPPDPEIKPGASPRDEERDKGEEGEGTGKGKDTRAPREKGDREEGSREGDGESDSAGKNGLDEEGSEAEDGEEADKDDAARGLADESILWVGTEEGVFSIPEGAAPRPILDRHGKSFKWVRDIWYRRGRLYFTSLQGLGVIGRTGSLEQQVTRCKGLPANWLNVVAGDSAFLRLPRPGAPAPRSSAKAFEKTAEQIAEAAAFRLYRGMKALYRVMIEAYEAKDPGYDKLAKEYLEQYRRLYSTDPVLDFGQSDDDRKSVNALAGLWIGTNGHGLALQHKGRWAVFHRGNSRVNASSFNDVYVDSQDNIWFATQGGGVLRYGTYLFLNDERMGDDTAKDAAFKILDVVPTCMVAAGHRLWVGTAGEGLYCYDQRNGDVTVYTADKVPLGSDKISCLALDHQNCLWIGTAGGSLRSFDGATWRDLSGLFPWPVETITALTVDDKTGKAWVAGPGYAGPAGRRIFLLTEGRLMPTRTAAVPASGGGAVRIAAAPVAEAQGAVADGGASPAGKESAPDPVVEKVFTILPTEHYTLAATRKAGVVLYDGYVWSRVHNKFQITTGRVDALARDGRGGLWLAKGAEVYRFDGSRWKGIVSPAIASEGAINALAADDLNPDNVWVACGTARGTVIAVWTGGAWQSRQLDKNVRSFIVDDPYIWLATDQGVYRMSKRK